MIIKDSVYLAARHVPYFMTGEAPRRVCEALARPGGMWECDPDDQFLATCEITKEYTECVELTWCPSD